MFNHLSWSNSVSGLPLQHHPPQHLYHYYGQNTAARQDSKYVNIIHTYPHIKTISGYPMNIPLSRLFRMSKLSAFCDSTSLHGWPHIPGSSARGKIFWAVTILAMAGLAVYLCTRCIFKSPSFEANLIFTQNCTAQWTSLELQPCQPVWSPLLNQLNLPPFPKLSSAINTNWGILRYFHC